MSPGKGGHSRGAGAAACSPVPCIPQRAGIALLSWAAVHSTAGLPPPGWGLPASPAELLGLMTPGCAGLGAEAWPHIGLGTNTLLPPAPATQGGPVL